MALNTTALVTLPEAKNYMRKDAAAALHVDAEYVGAGDGAETHFSLDHAPVSGSLKLYLNNIPLTETTHFTISGANITFVVYPPNGQPITASYDYAAGDDTFEGYDDVLLEHLINAATKKCEDETGRAFIQRSITDSINGSGMDALRLPKAPVVSVSSVSYRRVVVKTGDATTLAFALGYTPKSDTLTVYIDGVLKSTPADYSLSAQTVTFTAAPALDAEIVFRFEVKLTLGTNYTEKLHMARLVGSWVKDYEYVVTYTAGYGSTRVLAQAAVPEAVMAVLAAVAIWAENRLGVKSEGVTGVGSVEYSDPGHLPALSRSYLSRLNRNLI
jgi:hypothetical protein